MLNKRALFFVLLGAHLSLKGYSYWQVNYGIMSSVYMEINAGTFSNYGTLYGIMDVSIDAGTLSGTGTISGKNIMIKADKVDYSGQINADTLCTIKASKFGGEGTIQATNLRLSFEECTFKGTLTYKDCIIYSKKEFDHRQLTCKGAGPCTIIITQNDVRIISFDALVSELSNKLYDECLSIESDAYLSLIKKGRTTAVLNRYSDLEMLKAVKTKIEEKVAYHAGKKHVAKDPEELNSALVLGGLSAIGFGLSGAAYYHRESLVEPKYLTNIAVGSLAGSAVSMFLLICSAKHFRDWQHPRHREKFDALTKINIELAVALETPRKPEEIIKVLS